MAVTADELRQHWRTAPGIQARAIPYDPDDLAAGLVGLHAAGMSGPDDVLIPLVAAVLDAVRIDRAARTSCN